MQITEETVGAKPKRIERRIEEQRARSFDLAPVWIALIALGAGALSLDLPFWGRLVAAVCLSLGTWNLGRATGIHAHLSDLRAWALVSEKRAADLTRVLVSQTAAGGDGPRSPQRPAPSTAAAEPRPSANLRGPTGRYAYGIGTPGGADPLSVED